MALFKKRDEFGDMPAMPNLNLPPMQDFPPFSPNISQPQLRDLTGRGYPSTDVLQSMQASQMSPGGMPQMRNLPPLPAPPVFRPSTSLSSRAPTSTEEMQEIAEAIIAEKWQKFGKEFDELKRTQEDISSTISGMQERISGVEKKMDMVIQEILGRVEEYGKGISDVGTELKAMQKVFGTVMPSFTENVKELQELVGDAKTQGFKKSKRKKK